MTKISLEIVYEVPSSIDKDGEIWHRCLDDMHFAAAKVGWAVGSAQVLYTQDGGKTWINQYNRFPNQVFHYPHRVFAINATTCWVTTITNPSGIRCCYTQDGGQTWQAKRFETDIYPKDIFFINQKLGWIVSSDGRIPARSSNVLFSDDAGESWNAFDVRMKGNPDKIRFVNASKGWLLQDSFSPKKTQTTSKLAVSADGGQTWQVNKVFDREIRDVCILDADSLVVTGEDGFIAKTSNNGKSWMESSLKSQEGIEAIAFHNLKQGLAVGSQGAILFSDNGGETWEMIETTSRKHYEGAMRLHFTSATTGVIASSTSIYSFKLCE